MFAAVAKKPAATSPITGEIDAIVDYNDDCKDESIHAMTAFPSYQLGNYKFRPGRPRPFGATVVPDGINFSIFSCHATSCSLVLFKKGAETPLIEIPFLESFRTGDVYAMTVIGLDPAEIEYGFRLDGPFEPAAGHRFDA